MTSLSIGLLSIVVGQYITVVGYLLTIVTQDHKPSAGELFVIWTWPITLPVVLIWYGFIK